MKTLREALAEARENEPQGVVFQPSAFYSKVGNILVVYNKDHEGAYSEQIDPILTLHRDMQTNEIVGYTLWIDSIDSAKQNSTCQS